MKNHTDVIHVAKGLSTDQIFDNTYSHTLTKDHSHVINVARGLSIKMGLKGTYPHTLIKNHSHVVHAARGLRANRGLQNTCATAAVLLKKTKRLAKDKPAASASSS